MAKRAISPKRVHTPHTRASKALMQNLTSVTRVLNLSAHEAKVARALAARAIKFVNERCDHATKRGQAKMVRSMNRLTKTLDDRLSRIQTLFLWQTVILVTCIEAYLQDMLAASASVDPKLMSQSEQRAMYADIIAATSLEALASGLRTRWARWWLGDGGGDSLDIAPQENGSERLSR